MAWWHERPGCGLVATGIALEALAVTGALDGRAALAVAAHLASCGGIALGLGRRLPAGATGVAFVMAVFLPMLGGLGAIAVAWVHPAVSAGPRPPNVRTPIPGPEAARVHAGRPVPRNGMPASARVLAARGRDDPGAIALLRRALADRDEEVRLVAHAVLESKQRTADRSLHEAACELDAAPPERRAMLEVRLAAEHWELVRTGLADGECLVPALERAYTHARAAIAEHPRSAELALRMARIELHRGRLADAEAALARALELGLPPAIAAPYAAELAFRERRFDRVRLRLTAAPVESAAVDRIRRFWS